MNRKTGLLLLLGLTASAMAVNIDDKLFIGGYTSFEFAKMLNDEGKGDKNGSFDADGADLVIAYQQTDRVRIAMDLNWEHGAATESGLGNVGFEYVYPEYRVFDWLKLRGGKMFTPFGIYNEIHTAKPAYLTIKEAYSTGKIEKMGSDERFYPRWITGVEVTGDVEVGANNLNYAAFVGNGDQADAGLNIFEEDNDKNKAVGGRVLFSTMGGMVIGSSIYFDTKRSYEIPDGEEDPVEVSKENILSVGGQATIPVLGASIELEGIYGQYGDLNRFGGSAMVSYLLKERYTPYIRWESHDPDLDTEDDIAQQVIYGVNTRLDGNLFLKLEMGMVISNEGNSRFKGVDYTEFKAAFVAGF